MSNSNIEFEIFIELSILTDKTSILFFNEISNSFEIFLVSYLKFVN